MAKVFLICGKLCCGKTTYAHTLRKKHRAVLLSCDEVMLALFNPYLGSTFESVSSHTREYLLEKSLEILDTDIDVILDWGFWTKEVRRRTKAFYADRGIQTEMHYLEVSDDVWQSRITKRNTAVEDRMCKAYYVDEGLMHKFKKRFEAPSEDEIDVKVSAD